MKLHYKKEHISCTNYKSESYEGFGIGTLTSGSMGVESRKWHKTHI